MNAVQAHQYKVVVHDRQYAMQSHVSFIARRERRNERALVHWGCVLVLLKGIIAAEANDNSNATE